MAGALKVRVGGAWVTVPTTGPGVAPGGALGQVLAKNSATDFDTEWVDPPTGGGSPLDNEVFIGPDDPGIGSPFELWFDTDEPQITVGPHHETHEVGGGDPLKLDDLNPPDDNTDLDVSTTRHGLAPKLVNNGAYYLAGDGTWKPIAILSGTLAQQPTGLTAANAGLLYQILAPYFHTVRWDGTKWEFAPGDCGNGFFSERAIVPQEGGWQLCDGTVSDYLKVGGASLTVQAFTTPAMTGGAYLKSAAAYDGAVNAAVGGTSGLGGAGTTGGGGPALTDVGGPTVTGAADRALYANTGGPTATGAADRSLNTTTSALPEGYTAGAGGHGHNAWADGVGDHDHNVPGQWTNQCPDNTTADLENDVGTARSYHSHWVPDIRSHGGGGHNHAIWTQAVGDHSHWIGGHSHTVPGVDHLHGIAQHTHTVTDHLHGIAQHQHGLTAHSHSLPDHQHSVPATEPARLHVLLYFRR